MIELSILRTCLDAPRATVWASVASAEGINHELGPWLRMTVPAGVDSLDLDHLPTGQRLGRSWLLLGGVLPVDYDDLRLERLVPGEGFDERSTMLSARVWEHRRWLRDDGPGRCIVEDRVSFEPRVPGTSMLLRAIAGRVFAHRHDRLLARFGGQRLA